MSATSTAGSTSLSFWDEENGIAVGGDISLPDSLQANVAILSDGGRSARLATSPAFPGPIYGVAHVPGSSPPILVAVGLTDPRTATTYVAAGVGVVEALSLVLASVKARNGLRKAIYGFGAAVLVLLKLAGVVTDGQESHVLELLGHGLALVPLVLAVVRTSPQTPTGEPVDEYRARHGAVVGVPEP